MRARLAGECERANRVEEVVDRERLAQYSVGARRPFGVELGRSRDDDDGDSAAAQLAEQRVAALVPDPHVEEHEHDALRVQLPPRLAERRRLDDAKTLELQVHATEQADSGLVVAPQVEEHEHAPLPSHPPPRLAERRRLDAAKPLEPQVHATEQADGGLVVEDEHRRMPFRRGHEGGTIPAVTQLPRAAFTPYKWLRIRATRGGSRWPGGTLRGLKQWEFHCRRCNTGDGPGLRSSAHWIRWRRRGRCRCLCGARTEAPERRLAAEQLDRLEEAG